MTRKTIHIIGSGFSSLSAACYLAREGHRVVVLEKNDSIGGRARQWQHRGFTFDMGPSWYWMPDVFERFFGDFGKKTSDYYALIKLDPAYRVYFGKDDFIEIAGRLEAIKDTFETHEKGSAAKLQRFIDQAKKYYDIAIKDIVYRPGISPLELVTPETLLHLSAFFGNISAQVRRHFKNPKLISILEFPVLFLGAKPSQTPPFYSFMNHADFGLGTWYPENGMFDLVRAMQSLAAEWGVVFKTGARVEQLLTEGGKVSALRINGETVPCDVVVSGADYAHTETLLEPDFRQYSEKYWSKRIFAPTCLVFYVGFDRKIGSMTHHALFFDADFDRHAEAIYDQPQWPEKPLFYANFPSLTDASAAPEGMESAFFLIPLAPDIEDSEALREAYFQKIMDRLAEVGGQDLRNAVLFKRSYCKNDFISDYNAYKGNAYGLANTLLQTAFLRPGLKSKKLDNLFFTGQLTVPGPGVPPALISGKLVAGLVTQSLSRSL